MKAAKRKALVALEALRRNDAPGAAKVWAEAERTIDDPEWLSDLCETLMMLQDQPATFLALIRRD